jgi:hypothetical protein
MNPILYTSECVANGRNCCYIGNHKSIRKYRLIMMNFLHTRNIPRRLVIHHINGNKLDDRLENLSLTTQTIHAKTHINPYNIPKEERRKKSLQKYASKQSTKDREKLWRENNKERIKENDKQYVLLNKERLKVYRKEYYIKNKETILLKNKLYKQLRRENT